MCRTLFSQHILLLDFSSYNLSLLKMWDFIQTIGEILGAWRQSSCKEHFFISTYCYLIYQVTVCHCKKCGTLFKPKERFWVHGDRAHVKNTFFSADIVTWFFKLQFVTVKNVGLNSNQRRDSGCMETEFMEFEKTFKDTMYLI